MGSSYIPQKYKNSEQIAIFNRNAIIRQKIIPQPQPYDKNRYASVADYISDARSYIPIIDKKIMGGR